MGKDVLQVLAEDHAVLGWLADRVQAAPEGRARAVLFKELARALAAHQTVIDRTVLPALKDIGWSGVTSDVLSGHMALKRTLAEAVALERNAPGPDDGTLAVAPRAKAQCERERDTLLPALHRLDDGQRALLGLDAEQHLTRLLGEVPTLNEDADMATGASDLVQEAYVVLGSLPARDGPPRARR